jgi:hypothetical protein
MRGLPNRWVLGTRTRTHEKGYGINHAASIKSSIDGDLLPLPWYSTDIGLLYSEVSQSLN